AGGASAKLVYSSGAKMLSAISTASAVQTMRTIRLDIIVIPSRVWRAFLCKVIAAAQRQGAYFMAFLHL
ncbi:MAG: hypothetical protein RRZ93_04140, partial [Ruthenibacterium sp.]